LGVLGVCFWLFLLGFPSVSLMSFLLFFSCKRQFRAHECWCARPRPSRRLLCTA
jgi:hypothetical protein